MLGISMTIVCPSAMSAAPTEVPQAITSPGYSTISLG